MAPRVTFTQINTVVMGNLNKNYGKLAKLQEQLSSGKAINRPSDAPIEITNDLEIRSKINGMNQHKRNITDGESYLGILDSSMLSSNNLVQRVRELSIQGASDTYNAEERLYVNNDMRQGLYQLVSISNTKHKDDYMLSGKNTDVPPFTVENGKMDVFTSAAPVILGDIVDLYDHSLTDGTLPSSLAGNPRAETMVPGMFEVTPNTLEEGVDYTIDYQNGQMELLTPAAVGEANADTLSVDFEWIRRSEEDLSGHINRETSPGVIMQINITADDMFGNRRFGEMDAFTAIVSSMEGLHENNGDAIRTGIGNLDEAYDRILSAQSTAGSRYNRLQSEGDRTSEKIIQSTDLQSQLEDLDFAKAISDFMLQDSVYNASLQSASRILQPSLVDFV